MILFIVGCNNLKLRLNNKNMKYKIIILVVSGFLNVVLLKAKDWIAKEYEGVNSIYQNHIKKDLDYYYLYYKPIVNKFSVELEDSLSNYLDNSEIFVIKNQFESVDVDYTWSQIFLCNCKVIQDKKTRELQSKNTHISVIMIDSLTGQPVNNYIDKNVIPIEEKQFYNFTKPIWNSDKSLAIFGTEMDEGNHGEIRTYIYIKENNNWIILTKLQGIDWDKQ